MDSCHILINLTKKSLLLLRNDTVLRTFPIICGRNSHLGTKEEEGDQRTPRGEYFVCTINEKSKFTLFFGLSYPDHRDARKAFDEGRITREELERIEGKLAEKKRPPWDTPLGGEVGIHGGGIERDGTRGCIGMKDEDVLFLKSYISTGMPVRITD